MVLAREVLAETQRVHAHVGSVHGAIPARRARPVIARLLSPPLPSTIVGDAGQEPSYAGTISVTEISFSGNSRQQSQYSLP